MVRQRIFRVTVLVGLLVLLSALALAFKDIHVLGLDREGNGPMGLTLGLDLKGGSHLVYQATFPDEVDVGFDVPVGTSVERDQVLSTLARYLGADVVTTGDNSFSVTVPQLGLVEETEVENAVARLGLLADFQSSTADGVTTLRITFDIPDSGESIQQEQLLAALAEPLGATVKAAEDNRFTIQLQGLTLQGEENASRRQEIREALADGVAPVVDFVVRRREPTADDLEGAVDTINRRINALGTTEPIVQRLGSDRVVVQLPGVQDLEQAKDLIGDTAQLVLLERTCGSLGPQRECLDFTETEIGDGLTGEDLSDAFPDRDAAGLPAITINFNSHGASLFADLTRRIANNNLKRIAFYLDDEELLAPVSQAYIPDGRTIITGNFTVEETRQLAIQLKSGSIPVPLSLVRESTVDATLGEDSLRDSLIAGVVGLALIAVFMIVYYRAAGFVAAVALAFYAVLLLATFKMLPVTLTLSGIAGVILSIGMAVDANVLIFERVKEELRSGRTLASSMEVGFRRAWTAIFDGNVSTLITCAILWWLGSRLGAPQVTGFALTLGLGVAVSMFTAVTVSRNLLQLMSLTRVGRKVNLFTPEGVTRPVGIGGGSR